jgi:L-aminopeptidase/D-esterase-like protein
MAGCAFSIAGGEHMQSISIRDLKGFFVGNAEDSVGGTGCTVILCPEGAPCGVDVRGGGPAARETELLKPTAAVDRVHAVALCGGSAFGLDAAAGVMKYLEERGIGFDTGVVPVPIVCASSIFDLACGSAQARPDGRMGYEACVAAAKHHVAEGNHGAGTGATVGKFHGPAYMMKSGLGIYAVQEGDLQVAAIVAVNALGDVYDWRRRRGIIAGMLNEHRDGFADTERCMLADYSCTSPLFGRHAVTNTTIAAVLTNAAFDKTAMNKIAAMAGNGMVRAISPVNTMADGDSVYALSAGAVSADINVVGTLAAVVLEKAIVRAVETTVSAYGISARCDFPWIDASLKGD